MEESSLNALFERKEKLILELLLAQVRTIEKVNINIFFSILQIKCLKGIMTFFKNTKMFGVTVSTVV